MGHDVSQPINLSSIFSFQDLGSPGSFTDGCVSNPNRESLEKRLAELEGGEAALRFSSGLVASISVFHLLKAGDHLICPKQCYWGTKQQILKLLVPVGIQYDYIDMRDNSQVRDKINDNTRKIFVETSSNHLFQINDIKGLSRLITGSEIIHVCDNAVLTAEIQKPLGLGAEIVIFSISKAINGHSDVIGGAVVCRKMDHNFSRLKYLKVFGGSVLSPYDCWWTGKGELTLNIRLQHRCEKVKKATNFFRAHHRVKEVHYPFEERNPQVTLSKKQMKQGGGLFPIDFENNHSDGDFIKRL